MRQSAAAIKFMGTTGEASSVSARGPASEEGAVAATTQSSDEDSTVKPWERLFMESGKRPRHTLRICNAYPYDKAINVFLNDVELYGDMAYKECDDFVNLQLVSGDQLRFKTEVDHHQHSAGIFEIAELPPYSSTLLLVITRHDTVGNSVAFESHVFRESANAQVAVIDTYKGRDKARMTITHHATAADADSENLPFGSVHRINSGIYDLVMGESDGVRHWGSNLRKPLVALPTHSYVVLRVGIEDSVEPEDDAEAEQHSEEGIPGDMTYPEDLIVFPLSKEERLRGGAGGGRSAFGAVFWALLAGLSGALLL